MKKAILYATTAIAALSSCAQQRGTSEQTSADDKVPGKVLVVVDVQRDFFDPAGSLYVTGSEELPAKIAAIATDYDAVVFTLDWHPGNHCSFKSNGGIWPSHCVAYTQGAGLADEFAGLLGSDNSNVQIYRKGRQQDKEQYGAFDDLEEDDIILKWLKGCSSIDVCGIAGDYCVKESTANILKITSADKVTLLNDCIRSIDDGSALKAFAAENGIKLK